MKTLNTKKAVIAVFLVQLSMQAFNQPLADNIFLHDQDSRLNSRTTAMCSSVTPGELYTDQFMNDTYDTLLMTLDNKGRVENVKLSDSNSLTGQFQKDEDRVLQTLSKERKHTMAITFASLASFLGLSVVFQQLRRRNRRIQTEVDRFVAASHVHIDDFRNSCSDEEINNGLNIFFKMHAGFVSGITDLKQSIEEIAHRVESENVKENLQFLSNSLSGSQIQASSRVHELGKKISENADNLFLQKLNAILQAGLPDSKCHKEVYIEKDVSTEIPTGLKIVLLEIVVEGVANIIKHTRARHAEILVTKDDNHIVLRINDSGKGFNKRITKPGNGFRYMLGKVVKYNGELFVESDKLGTSLKIVFPGREPLNVN